MIADVAIIGAGPVGMTLALLLADRGVSVALVEARTDPGQVGSKALCMQRETLEIWDSIGIGEWVAGRGTAWSVGRTYFGERELFSITLPGSGSEHFPPFVNISQSEVEAALADRVGAHPQISITYGQSVLAVDQSDDAVTISTAPSASADLDAAQRDRALSGAGTRVRARYVVGTDGARSEVRRLLGIDFPGHSHADRFLIADIRAELPFPAERRFWFDPPFNPGRTVLVHPQPDGVWRIDWQVPADFDLEAERASGCLDERIRQVIGDASYEPVWITVYRFHQRCAERWRVGRAFLAGDAAHLMSPFGARGLNSGVADVANLAWKLEHVLRGAASDALLDSYVAERLAAARENLSVTDATMRFMAPRAADRAERDAILLSSIADAAARSKVNSGRLATPMVHAEGLFGAPRPGDPPLVGSVLVDLPVSGGQRLRRVLAEVGGRWLALTVGAPAPPAPEGVRSIQPADPSPDSHVTEVYAPDGVPRTWLIRPDAYVAACVEPDPVQLAAAYAVATAAG